MTANIEENNKTASEVKAASQKQMHFMKAISKASGLDIPDEAKNDSRSAREWIQEGLQYCEENGIIIGKSEKAPEQEAKEATQKQQDFIKVITEAARIAIPEDVLSDSRAASEFIKETLDYCKENGIIIGKSIKTTEYEAKEATQRQKDFMQIIAEATGIAIPEDAYSNSKDSSKYIKDGLKFCEDNNIIILSEKQSIIYEAKEALGANSFVTIAQNGATYDGKIVASTEHFAVQEVLEKKGILHDLNDNIVLKSILDSEPMQDVDIRISYNDKGKALVGNVADITEEIVYENEY